MHRAIQFLRLAAPSQQRGCQAQLLCHEYSRGWRRYFGKLGATADCDGRCHAECEQRHLDTVERTRDSSWAWPEEPQLIVCAGPERSGSTWLFNAARLLHRQLRVPCDSYWIHTLTEDKLTERLSSGAHVIIKTHLWEPQYREMLPRFSRHIVITHRDLRGVVASYRRVGWARSLPRKYVDDHMQWRSLATLDVKYENVVRDGKLQLAELASHLGLPFSDGDIAAVHRDLADLQSSRRAGPDQVTKLWPGHISIDTKKYMDCADAEDAGLNPLEDETEEQSLLKRFPEFMVGYGYTSA
mmetsp:Transcript_3603/g.8484  ORF Transcript_3603/g.8484 Transcript_3603/m.8484 type:complete len:298 (+) Transcript_3603:70-963(+)